MDLDLPDDEEDEYSRSRGRDRVIFEAQVGDEEQAIPQASSKPSRPAGQQQRADDRDQEDLWAGL